MNPLRRRKSSSGPSRRLRGLRASWRRLRAWPRPTARTSRNFRPLGFLQKKSSEPTSNCSRPDISVVSNCSSDSRMPVWMRAVAALPVYACVWLGAALVELHSRQMAMHRPFNRNYINICRDCDNILYFASLASDSASLISLHLHVACHRSA